MGAWHAVAVIDLPCNSCLALNRRCDSGEFSVCVYSLVCVCVGGVACCRMRLHGVAALYVVRVVVSRKRKYTYIYTYIYMCSLKQFENTNSEQFKTKYKHFLKHLNWKTN